MTPSMNTIAAIAIIGALVLGGWYLWTHKPAENTPYQPPPPPPAPVPQAHRSNVADVIIAGFNSAPGVIQALR